MLVHDKVLRCIDSCPHCGIAKPLLSQKWISDCIDIPNTSYGKKWGVYICSSCNKFILAEGKLGNQSTNEIECLYPEVKEIPNELPERAKKFLEQAFSSLNAPDGAAMLAGSAVDSMLKEKGLKEGSVYTRIETAVKDGILTKEMGEWAHEVRLGSNRPRHSDEQNPHVTPQEAEQACEFASTLGYVLFVLPERVSRGKKAAEAAS